MVEHLAKNPIAENERIAMVCHSTTIRALTSTGTGLTEEGHLNGIHPDNCEIQPHKF
jgi:broad specificity phosphatase PhoE